jgi:hypothetical protein
MPDATDTLHIGQDLLTRLAKLVEPHNHALLTAVRKEFGDDATPTLFGLAIGMMLGALLRTIPNADRAPDGFAQLLSFMRVPFSIEPKRVQ